jgi:hypothetical protein
LFKEEPMFHPGTYLPQAHLIYIDFPDATLPRAFYIYTPGRALPGSHSPHTLGTRLAKNRLPPSLYVFL